MYVAITGRESNLAKAELEAVFGKISPLGDSVIALGQDNIAVDKMEYLGFTKKLAQICVESIDKNSLATEIADSLLKSSTSTGKLSFGISWYCKQQCDKKYYLDLAKKVKTIIQENGRSARFIQPKDGFELNAAQIHYNQLLKKGCEVVVYGSSSTPSIAITKWVFNPSVYSHRDYDRPARSAKVGMFPPKLAQVLINLAQAETTDTVCDPFCGSGMVLQEALFAGHNVVGSDNSSEMVLAAQKNLGWFERQFRSKKSYTINQADAQKFAAPKTPYVIVSEGYLGPGLSQSPSVELLSPIQVNLEKLYINFLTHIARLNNLPKSVVITLPFWQTTTGISYLKVIDQITNLGYTIRQFNSVDSTRLFYKRSHQIVGRQVLVLELKKA